MIYNLTSIANRLDTLYVTFRQRFIMAREGKIFVPKSRGGEKPLYLKREILNGHLEYRYAVGVYAGPKSSKFVCFDVDLPDKDIVRSLIDKIDEFGFPRDRIYVSTSGGKGYHVELFFNSTVFTSVLCDFYRAVIRSGGFDPRKVEFRPTATQSIKLPLSVHPRTGNVCWYLDRETLEPIMDPGYVFKIEQIDRDWATNLIRSNAELQAMEYISYDSDNIPPCSERTVDITRYEEKLPQMNEAGTMHNLMVSIAVHERYCGKTEPEIQEMLVKWAEAQDERYVTNSRREIDEDAAGIAKWVWRPEFRIGEAKRGITKAEMDLILSQRGGAKRKLLFLIILFCKFRGEVFMSNHQMMRYTGLSFSMVNRSLADMEKNGVIRTSQVKRWREADGGYHSKPKGYTYKKPNDTGGAEFFVDWSFRADEFMKAYRDTVEFFVPKEKWNKVFYKKELEELLNV